MTNTMRHDHLELHAIKRARERYDVGPEVVDDVRRIIKRTLRNMKRRAQGKSVAYISNAARLRILTQNRSLWRVTVEAETYLVVYEAPTNSVVTFLPKDHKL